MKRIVNKCWPYLYLANLLPIAKFADAVNFSDTEGYAL